MYSPSLGQDFSPTNWEAEVSAWIEKPPIRSEPPKPEQRLHPLKSAGFYPGREATRQAVYDCGEGSARAASRILLLAVVHVNVHRYLSLTVQNSSAEEYHPAHVLTSR
jgi:hypothetical protein